MALLNAIRQRDVLGKNFTFNDSFVGESKLYEFPLHPLGEFGLRSLEPHIVRLQNHCTT